VVCYTVNVQLQGQRVIVQTASSSETSVTTYTNTHGVMSKKMATLFNARTRISSPRRTPETPLIPVATQFRRLSNHKILYVVPSKFLFPPSCYGSKVWTQFPFPTSPNIDVPQHCVPDVPSEWLANLRVSGSYLSRISAIPSGNFSVSFAKELLKFYIKP